MIRQIIGSFVNWLLKIRPLYITVGYAAATYLFLELVVPTLPELAQPDYDKIGKDYGEIPKTILGFFISKFAGGVNMVGVYISLGIIIFCLLLEYKRFSKSGKTFNFFGINQTINQTFNENDEK